jgi:RNA polymerase sigma-70 factor (ECF subfamily)
MQQPTNDIIERSRKRERQALSDLYDHVFPFWYAMTKRYLFNKEDRETLVNNAFIKLVDSLNNYDSNGSFEAWSRVIMRNVIIDEYRRNKTRRAFFSEDKLEEQDTLKHASNSADAAFETEELEGYLMRLPPVTRMAFNLFAIEGLSHKEIATTLSISEGTSKWHISEARRQLKAMIEFNQSLR